MTHRFRILLKVIALHKTGDDETINAAKPQDHSGNETKANSLQSPKTVSFAPRSALRSSPLQMEVGFDQRLQYPRGWVFLKPVLIELNFVLALKHHTHGLRIYWGRHRLNQIL
jgi:hypothetical protein